ncbi:MAG: DNA-processing protein DprA, partial [Cystobacter sp.]
MVDVTANSFTGEQRALLALWSVPGLGPRTLGRLRSFAEGALARLIACPVTDWLADSPLPPPVRRRLIEGPPLEEVAARLLERCARAGMAVAFQGEPGYPARLAVTEDAPPLLFHRGQVGPPRRRAARGGSPPPEKGFRPVARPDAPPVGAGGGGGGGG